METQRADIAVIGAGIVGLAHARAAAARGLKVVLFERSARAVGASIRNFGLIWPIGQPSGPLYERALRSRAIWLDIAREAGIWHAASGSLHLAYHADEVAVLEEYLETTPAARDQGCRLLTPAEVAQKSAVARQAGLRAALWSPTELNVDPRQAIRAFPAVLERRYGVTLRFDTPVSAVVLPFVETPQERWQVERAVVCSGADFATLFPQLFASSGITRCKLQMLRTAAQPAGWQLGPALCAGLTLLHYDAFRHCTGLGALRARVQRELPFYVANQIHVLVSQTAQGEVTIGDSHEYGPTPEPFDQSAIDTAILRYFAGFAALPNPTIAERWHGIYPIIPGQSELIAHPAPGVTVVNGLRGAGMTLSFGLAEEVIAQAVDRASVAR